jgi:threonine/homoserine/homoserine lactone efflux protein
VVLNVLAASFDWLRWAGVAYLVWLGIAAWRAPAADLAKVGPQPRSARPIFARGFLVGLTNPKTLLFYGAFLPQFITPGPTVSDQLLLLAVTFLGIAIVLDSAWALLAARLRALLVARVRLRNRLTGGLLVGAGLGLALARRP